jgi:hypothetical protein
MAETKNTWPRLRSLQRQNKLAFFMLIPGTIVTAILFNVLFMVKSAFPLMAITWVIYLYWTNASLYGQSCPACGFPFVNKQRFFTFGSFWAKRCDHCGASE